MCIEFINGSVAFNTYVVLGDPCASKKRSCAFIAGFSVYFHLDVSVFQRQKISKGIGNGEKGNCEISKDEDVSFLRKFLRQDISSEKTVFFKRELMFGGLLSFFSFQISFPEIVVFTGFPVLLRLAVIPEKIDCGNGYKSQINPGILIKIYHLEMKFNTR